MEDRKIGKRCTGGKDLECGDCRSGRAVARSPGSEHFQARARATPTGRLRKAARTRHSPNRRGCGACPFGLSVLNLAIVRSFHGVKLISWNVNGLRAVLRKNFLEYLDAEKPNMLCLQETKCSPDDVEQLWPAHYTTYWNCARKKGYDGTAIFTRPRPVNITTGIRIAEHDHE